MFVALCGSSSKCWTFLWHHQLHHLLIIPKYCPPPAIPPSSLCLPPTPGVPVLLIASHPALLPPSSPRPPSASSLCPPPSLPIPPRSPRPALLHPTGMPPLHKQAAPLTGWLSQSPELVGFSGRVSRRLPDLELCSSARKTRADRFGSFISTAGQKLGSPGMGRE